MAKDSWLFLIIGALVVSLTFHSSIEAQERGMGGVGITVFKDRDFRGSSATYTRDMPSLASVGFNRNISSFRVGDNERWEVCDQPNYRGNCVAVYGEESDLRRNNWDNKIASFRRVGGSPPTPGPSNPYIVLYDQTNYRGLPTNYSAAASNLDRRAQSVTIGSGSWEFCDGPNFSGRCITLDRSTPNLSTIGMNRRVASVRPAGFAPPEPPLGSDWYVVLYTQANYRGTPTNYRGVQSRISKTTGSVTIGKGVWEICTGNNFSGRCEILNSSVPNIAVFGVFGRTIRSLRPVLPQPR